MSYYPFDDDEHHRRPQSNSFTPSVQLAWDVDLPVSYWTSATGRRTGGLYSRSYPLRSATVAAAGDLRAGLAQGLPVVYTRPPLITSTKLLNQFQSPCTMPRV